VVEQQSFALQSHFDPSSGLQHVFAQGVDITSTLSGGQLGGTLQARDQAIPAVETQLDNLAASLGSAFNAQSAAGFDLSGAPGVTSSYPSFNRRPARMPAPPRSLPWPSPILPRSLPAPTAPPAAMVTLWRSPPCRINPWWAGRPSRVITLV
jgi:hypothetical protein